MRAAFKEWSSVVDALGSGEQILILRKGGIHEGRGGFAVSHSRFFLFPTQFHQQRDKVIESARERFDRNKAKLSNPDSVTLTYWAELVRSTPISSLEVAQRLRPFHVWEDAVIRERFEWNGTATIHALLLRVYTLSTPISLPNLPEYAGCKSWIELARDIALEGSTPVLTDFAFQKKMDALNGVLDEPRLAPA